MSASNNKTVLATKAPEDTPSSCASAKGFCNTACSKAPEADNMAPTHKAINILGNLKSIMVSIFDASPVESF